MLDVTQIPTAVTPSAARVFQALVAAGHVLGERYAYFLRGGYHFRLAPDWTMALTPESAGRIRLEACRSGAPMATLWCLADDRERLAALVAEIAHEVHALAGARDV